MSADIYVGDCIELIKDIPDKTIDAVITDPPYNVLDSSHVNWEDAINLGIFDEMSRVLNDTGTIALFSSWQLWFEMMKHCNTIKFRYEIIVKRTNYFGGGYKKRPINAHEYFTVWNKRSVDKSKIYYDELPLMTQGEPYSRGNPLKNGKNRIRKLTEGHEEFVHNNETGLRKPISVQEMRTKNHLRYEDRTDHPTQKDTVFLSKWILALCPTGGTVLDTYAGSGSTGVACVETNRNFIGYEINEEYANIAIDRINKCQRGLGL